MAQRKPPSDGKIFTVLIVFLLLITVGTAIFLYKKDQDLEHQASLKQTRIETEQKLAERKKQKEEIQALFDVFLNQFALDLKAGAKEYKKQNSVLREITQAYNFETPEYAKENYELFTEKIAPSMRRQANNIVGIFELYQIKIEEELSQKDDDIRDFFRQEWQEMSTKQAGAYVDFFTTEEMRLQAYGDLIKFYYVHSKRYDVDVAANTFLFHREKDARIQKDLILNITEIKR